MGIRHHIRRLNDPRQGRDIGRLLVNLVIHVTDQIFIGIDDCRDAHRAVRLNAPSGFVDTGKAVRIHVGSLIRQRRKPPTSPPSLSCTTSNAV